MRATRMRVIEENSMPPFRNALGRNMIPVPMKALRRVKNDLVRLASPALMGGRRVVLRRPSSGLRSVGCVSASVSASASLSTKDSSSDSLRFSPAKLPYNSRKETKFFVTGLVTFCSRFCF